MLSTGKKYVNNPPRTSILPLAFSSVLLCWDSGDSRTGLAHSWREILLEGAGPVRQEDQKGPAVQPVRVRHPHVNTDHRRGRPGGGQHQAEAAHQAEGDQRDREEVGDS